MTAPSWSPVDEYTRRQHSYEQQVEKLEARHRALGYVKLVLIAALGVTAWVFLGRRPVLVWPIFVPALLFVAVAIYHGRVLRQQAGMRRAAKVYNDGIARIEDRWPRTTERFVPEHFVASSLYAKDLDIVGKGSLFELLCIARTTMGEESLLQWLLQGPEVETIHQRQGAVAELRGLLDFRERMAIAGEAVSMRVRPEALKTWAQTSTELAGIWVRWLAGGLALAAIGAAAFWVTHGRIGPLFLVLLVERALVWLLRKRIDAAFSGTEQAFEDLHLVAALLAEIERQQFETPILQRLQEQLRSRTVPASQAIARLGTLVAYKDSLHNPFLALLNLPLMYSVHLAFAIHGWRERFGPALGAWLDALGEMEALLSLAAYSYEHPSDPFPVFVEGAACLHAEEMGHPLIPAEKCVRNSVHIGGPTRVLLISGSNMSGKSTLMRTVGVNTVLAQCGASVRAKQMRLTRVRLGASLLVNDSLQRGASRFYAEIEKLQQICSLAEQEGPPVLFLLDELLQGTNSKDRMAGAIGVTRELVRAGAIGILTTHDLSLTAMDDGGGVLKNMHFQDSIVDGQMRFDYRLQDGIVTKSNGLELMRLIGLKV